MASMLRQLPTYQRSALRMSKALASGGFGSVHTCTVGGKVMAVKVMKYDDVVSQQSLKHWEGKAGCSPKGMDQGSPSVTIA